MLKFKDFEQKLAQEYGAAYLESYCIYCELRKKIVQNNLTEDEAEYFCNHMYLILLELLDKPKANYFELNGFCYLLREQYKSTSYKTVVDELRTAAGRESIKNTLKESVNKYELVYLALKGEYSMDFTEELEIYRELRRAIIKSGINHASLDELLESVMTSSQTMDIGVSTGAEFAHILKILHIPAHEIYQALNTIHGKRDIAYRYETQRESLLKAQKILNRVRAAIAAKYASFPEFYRSSGVGHHPIRTLIYGGLPNISSFIKIAYATDTTLEYLLNGKSDKPTSRTPIEELLDNGRYVPDTFIKRIDEYCKNNSINQRQMLIDCGVNPFTPLAWNTDRREPATDVICRICDGQQLNIDYMLGLTNKKDESYFVTSV